MDTTKAKAEAEANQVHSDPTLQIPMVHDSTSRFKSIILTFTTSLSLDPGKTKLKNRLRAHFYDSRVISDAVIGELTARLTARLTGLATIPHISRLLSIA